MLLILTGKTASGKDTVMARLLSDLPGTRRVVTTTSRLPRENERDEFDYNFITPEDFKKKIANNEFIEYVEYGGNLYGTERKEILNNLEHNLIWRIDPSRAGQAREFIKESFEPEMAQDLLKKLMVVYLTVSDEVILERLKKRGLSEEDIKRRMTDDANFWQQYQKSYDFVVENIPGKLDQTIDRIIEITKIYP